jgi:hypothetical protein
MGSAAAKLTLNQPQVVHHGTAFDGFRLVDLLHAAALICTLLLQGGQVLVAITLALLILFERSRHCISHMQLPMHQRDCA